LETFIAKEAIEKTIEQPQSQTPIEKFWDNPEGETSNVFTEKAKQEEAIAKWWDNLGKDTAEPIDYIDDIKKIDKKDLNEARGELVRAHDFIKNSAETPVEIKTAEVLSEYFNSGKVVLSDTTERIGKDCYGFFNPNGNPKHSYIAVDINHVLDDGMAELVDTLSHEAYHAAQYNTGNKNDIIKEETHAWNLGLEMSNKYRGEHGETIVRTNPYTEPELFNMGYSNWEGYNGFNEICKEAV